MDPLARTLQRPKMLQSFVYAGADPINRLDPSGLIEFEEDLSTLYGDLAILARLEFVFLSATTVVSAGSSISDNGANSVANKVSATAGVWATATGAALKTKFPSLAAIPGALGTGVTVGCELGALAAGWSSDGDAGAPRNISQSFTGGLPC